MSNKTGVEYIYFLKGNTHNSHAAEQIFLHLSPYALALIFECLGNGFFIAFTFAQASQNLGFESGSSSIPLIRLLLTANFIAACAM